LKHHAFWFGRRDAALPPQLRFIVPRDTLRRPDTNAQYGKNASSNTWAIDQGQDSSGNDTPICISAAAC